MNLLVSELVERGHTVHVVSWDSTIDRTVSLWKGALRISLVPGRKKLRDRALDRFTVEREYMTAALIDWNPEIVHAHWTYEFALAAKQSNRPHLITVHDAPMRVLRWQMHPYRLIRLAMAYQALHGESLVCCVSPYLTRHLRRWGMYRGRTEIIPNGLPDELFERPVKTYTESEAPTFSTVIMGWGKLKNASVALLAFHVVRQSLPRARLYMYGEGYGEGQEAQEWARAHGVEEGVSFRGVRSHESLMNELQATTDILVHPSFEESHGLALVEAMVLGVPVIAGKYSGAVPWTLEEGRAGCLVNVASAKEVASAMLRLARDREMRSLLAATGRESAARRFKMMSIAGQYERLYEQVLALRKPHTVPYVIS